MAAATPITAASSSTDLFMATSHLRWQSLRAYASSTRNGRSLGDVGRLGQRRDEGTSTSPPRASPPADETAARRPPVLALARHRRGFRLFKRKQRQVTKGAR